MDKRAFSGIMEKVYEYLDNKFVSAFAFYLRDLPAVVSLRRDEGGYSIMALMRPFQG